jgi:hypothetical protein
MLGTGRTHKFVYSWYPDTASFTVFFITCISTREVQILNIDTRSGIPPSRVLLIDHSHPRSCRDDVLGHKQWTVFACHRDTWHRTQKHV